MAYRTKRNCSQVDTCEIRFGELLDKLVARGYRRRAVENAIAKVRVLDRQDILSKVIRVNNNSDRVRAVFKFDRRLPILSGCCWRLLLHPTDFESLSYLLKKQQIQKVWVLLMALSPQIMKHPF